MKVKFCGTALDYSGYGEANRHDIGALVSAGVEVTTEIPRYTMEQSDFGRLGNLASSLLDKFKDYNIKILHVTPNVYPQYYEAGKYHIGRVFWETDKLPAEFAKCVQMLDEVWTGSEFNKQAIINAGVTKPIYIVPEAIDCSIESEAVMPYLSNTEDLFRFYSIFEWTERKNPTALLTAYFQEFQDNEKVGFVLKTYVDNFSPERQYEIESNIKRIKLSLGLEYYPPLFLFKNLMDRHQIYRFHKSFDCFVSTHRGEGWGIPQMEAMLMEKPIISTNLGGVHEYLTDMTDALLLPAKMIKLESNTRNKQWYTSDQNWGDVEVSDVRKAMRWAYDHRLDLTKSLGKTGRKTIVSKFDLPVVGNIMLKRLQEIGR